MEHTEFIKQQILDHRKYIRGFNVSRTLTSTNGCFYNHPDHPAIDNTVHEDKMYEMIEKDLNNRCENIINHFHERF